MKLETFYVARSGWIDNKFYDDEQVGAGVTLLPAQAESYLLAGQLTRDKPAPRKK
jgi:hypothetical protein